MLKSILPLLASLSLITVASAEEHPIRDACKADIEKLCKDEKPGGGRIIRCLREKKEQVSEPCKAALKEAKKKREERRKERGEKPSKAE